MGAGDLGALIDRERLPARLDVAQLGPEWCCNKESMALRDELDSRIFAAFLREESVVVRRIVFLEPDPGLDARAAGEHRRWIAGLVRDLYYLDMPERGAGAAYQLRQLVRDPRPSTTLAMTDGWGEGDPETWTSTFAATWDMPGCIDSNVVPPEVDGGIAADRDPRWYLWH
jgi:hypothetical protein